MLLCEQYFICDIVRKSFLMGDVNVAVLLQDAWSRQLPMFANSFACKNNLYRNLTDSTNRNFACPQIRTHHNVLLDF